MKPWLKFAGVLLGLLLFGWFVYRAGVREIISAFDRLGPWLPIVLLPYLLVYHLDTLGWWFSFSPAERRPAFFLLLRLRWAGEVVNNLVPTGYIGGEAVKAWLLHRRGLSVLNATTSVVVGKTAQVAAQVLFIALGATLAVFLLPPHSQARRSFAWVAVLAFGALLLVFWIQSHGLFSFIRAVSSRLKIRRLAEKQAQFRELDDQIFGFYRQYPRSFAAAALAYFGGWLADSLEVFIASQLLGFPMGFETALVIESFVSIAKALGFFVPGALGVQESGLWLLFGLFGFTEPQAVTYALLRRGREVVYAAIGTALLYAEGASWRTLATRTRTHPIS